MSVITHCPKCAYPLTHHTAVSYCGSCGWPRGDSESTEDRLRRERDEAMGALEEIRRMASPPHHNAHANLSEIRQAARAALNRGVV